MARMPRLVVPGYPHHVTQPGNRPMLERVGNWGDYLSIKEIDSELDVIRQHTGTRRPAGGEVFMEGLEALTGKALKKGRPGPKPRIR